MDNNKTAKLWIVNAVSFISFSILTFTGLINWLFIPRGFDTGSRFVITLRHFFREVHQWTALTFIIVIVIHVTLHWTYIKSNLRNYGILK